MHRGRKEKDEGWKLLDVTRSRDFTTPSKGSSRYKNCDGTETGTIQETVIAGTRESSRPWSSCTPITVEETVSPTRRLCYGLVNPYTHVS